MPLTLEQKKETVKEVAALANASSAVIAADYRGISAGQFDEIRKATRENGIHFRVVKNTLLARSLAETPFAALSESAAGPMVYVFVGENLGVSGRLLKQYSEDLESFNVRWVAYEGKVASGEKALDRLAALPTRDEALAMLAAAMRAPLTKFAGTLRDLPLRLLRVLAAIERRRKENH